MKKTIFTLLFLINKISLFAQGGPLSPHNGKHLKKSFFYKSWEYIQPSAKYALISILIILIVVILITAIAIYNKKNNKKK